MSRFVSILLLLFGVEFIAAGRPFQSSENPYDWVFIIAGCTCLSIWHAIMWDRSER